MAHEINFDTDHIEWTHIPADDQLDYPVDYHMAILGSDPERGSLDLIVKWEPNSYCHFHRHIAATTILVLQGEQHIAEIDENGKEVGRKVRKAGDYARSSGGEAHMEWGGPEGAIVFFALQAQEKDGPIFEMLDREMNVLSSANVAEMGEGANLDLSAA